MRVRVRVRVCACVCVCVWSRRLGSPSRLPRSNTNLDSPSGYSEGAAAAATPESECMLLGVIASVDQLLVSLVLFYLLNIS